MNTSSCLLWILSVHLLLNGTSSAFLGPVRRNDHYTTLSAFFLNSALENLADIRVTESNSFRQIEWFDPSTAELPYDDEVSTIDSISIPLYPLSAVYIPFTGVNHTLNNVQPRTMKMAFDLDAMEISSDRLFCTALSAMDTGRISRTGTLMQVKRVQSTTSRVTVTCVPVATVDILTILNPRAASVEARIRRSSEYLLAQVVVRDMQDYEGEDDLELQPLAEQVCRNYNTVREFYLNKEVGVEDLPPFSVDKLEESLPQLTTVNMTQNFWNVAQLWQTLCYTVREGRQINLAADRNKLLVNSIMKQQKGPLNLPIQIGDLTPDNRLLVEQLEVDAQDEWLSLRLDPCLDFQVLLTMPSIESRLSWLGQMILREKNRLEENARNPPIIKVEERPPIAERRGAWFDDNWQS